MKDELKKMKFHYLIPSFYFPRRNELKRFILQQLKKEGKAVEIISYVFCDDNYLLAMNKKYLNHDTLTDIITFELSPKSYPLISDIYISVERVRENAYLFQTTFSDELLRVMFHGILHLVGFTDKTVQQSEMMRHKEKQYLDEFIISRGTSLEFKD